MLFPEFVTLYIDPLDKKTCIYYFRGLDNDGNYIYQQFNESQIPDEHTKTINPDGSIIYKFNKCIKSVKCNLIPMHNDNMEAKIKKIFIKI